MIKSEPELINPASAIVKNNWMIMHKCIIIIRNNTSQAYGFLYGNCGSNREVSYFWRTE